jgi:hypothetical protein
MSSVGEDRVIAADPPQHELSLTGTHILAGRYRKLLRETRSSQVSAICRRFGGAIEAANQMRSKNTEVGTDWLLIAYTTRGCVFRGRYLSRSHDTDLLLYRLVSVKPSLRKIPIAIPSGMDNSGMSLLDECGALKCICHNSA